MSDPGWYPDPYNQERLRWWDGENWSEDVKDVEPPKSPFPALPKRNSSVSLPPRLSERRSPASKERSVEEEKSARPSPPVTSPFPALPNKAVTSSSQPGRRSLPPPIERLSRPKMPPAVPEQVFPPASPFVSSPVPEMPAVPEYSPSSTAETFDDPEMKDPFFSPGMEHVEDTVVPYIEDRVSVHSAGLNYGLVAGDSDGVGVEERHSSEANPEEITSTPAKKPTKQKSEKDVSGKRFWTKYSLLITSFFLILSIGFPVGITSYRESLYDKADSVADGFLSSIVKGDSSWEEFATPEVFDPYYVPIAGSSEAAELVGLKVGIERSPIYYNNPCNGQTLDYMNFVPSGCSDRAQSGLTIKYKIGDSYEVEMLAHLYLSRPYYYGDDVPSAAVKDKEASKVGPWTVSYIDILMEDGTTKYYKSAEAESDENAFACSTVDSIIIQLSQKARIDGVISALCSVDEDLRAKAEDVDVEKFASTFPIYNEATVLNSENKTGVSSSYLSLPYSQYEINTDSGTYILSFILSKTDNDLTENRLISITKKDIVAESEGEEDVES